MKRVLIGLMLVGVAVAEERQHRTAKDMTDCRAQDIYPSSCIALYHWQTVFDGIAAFAGYPNYDAYIAAGWKRRAEEGRNLYLNAMRDLNELREEVKRLRESVTTFERAAGQTATPRYVAAPMPTAPAYTPPAMSEGTRPYYNIRTARPGANAGQSGTYTQNSTTLPDGTVQTLTSDGRQCYTYTMPGASGPTYQTQCY